MSKMVWAVVGAYSYEGYDEPDSVYSTREMAEARKFHLEQAKRYDWVYLFQYELDGQQASEVPK